MRLHIKLVLGLLCSVIIFCSCAKVVPEVTPPTEVVVPGDTTKTPVPTPGNYRTIAVGTGSGDLVIDGATLTSQCNDHFKIAKGAYKSITVKNFQSADGCTIVITNDGLVELAGDFSQMNLINLKGVTVSGDGTPSLKYGFQFHDNVYRAIVITKPYNRATIQNVSFKNIQNYVINYTPGTVYDGTPASYSQGLKFLNILCENTSSFIQFSGSVENGNIIGLIKDLEIAYLTFINSSTVGTMVWAGNVDGYDVHNNRVDNINSANDNHNGIFHLMGNGRFHDNYVSNHQGNALRAWTYSMGNTAKDVLIYNNIVINSRKYSAFEVQSFANYISGQVTYANAKVYNNTVGTMNTTQDWYGDVVDVYGLQGGTCQVFNNIGFNFPAPNPNNNISNQQSSTTPEDFNNLYFKTAADAGFSDQTKFTLSNSSPAKNKGVAVSNLTKDYYGSSRNTNNPSIGAVE